MELSSIFYSMLGVLLFVYLLFLFQL